MSLRLSRVSAVFAEARDAVQRQPGSSEELADYRRAFEHLVTGMSSLLASSLRICTDHPGGGSSGGDGTAPAAPVDEQVGSAAITVLIVDDEKVFRDTLRSLLAAEPDIDVVGEAGDGVEALVRANDIAPDAVIMDVRMHRMGGIKAARAIREALPSTRVLMLTASDEDEDLFGAIRAGANGYLVKYDLHDIASAVRAAVKGESTISPPMASKLLEEFASFDPPRAGESVASPSLTPREREILKLISVNGLKNREMADRLGISENTVKNHVANTLAKLHLRSRLDLAIYAARDVVDGR